MTRATLVLSRAAKSLAKPPGFLSQQILMEDCTRGSDGSLVHWSNGLRVVLWFHHPIRTAIPESDVFLRAFFHKRPMETEARRSSLRLRVSVGECLCSLRLP